MNKTVNSLLTDALDHMMTIRQHKDVVTDESLRDGMEHDHLLDTVCTPSCTAPAPLSTSTPADVCMMLLSYVTWCGYTLQR